MTILPVYGPDARIVPQSRVLAHSCRKDVLVGQDGHFRCGWNSYSVWGFSSPLGQREECRKVRLFNTSSGGEDSPPRGYRVLAMLTDTLEGHIQGTSSSSLQTRHRLPHHQATVST